MLNIAESTIWKKVPVRRVLGVFVALAVVLFAAGMAAVEGDNPGSDSWQLVYQTVEGTQSVSYVTNLDGSGLTQLKYNGADVINPACSSDGSHLAFLVDGALYVGSTGTSTLDSLSLSEVGVVWQISVSNDGSTVAVSASPENPNSVDLFISDVAAGAWTRLTDTPDVDEDHPTLSPDAGRIAFEIDAEPSGSIYTVNRDGTNEMKVIEGGTMPAWSPDGGSIAFHAARSFADNIYMMDLHTSNYYQITHDPASHFSPAWSPDGLKIAFTATEVRSGWAEVIVTDTDGSSERRLTDAIPIFGPPCFLTERPQTLVGT
jgi:Tol biopolymer transport system component